MGEPAELLAWTDGTYLGHRHVTLSGQDLGRILALGESMPFGDDAFTLKRRRYQELGRLQPAGLDVALKRWRSPLGLPAADPARRAARHIRWLRTAGVPTPELLACLRATRPTRSGSRWLLVTRWLPEHRPITLLLAGHRPYERRLRGALPRIVDLVAGLHEGGLGHRDLRLENLLARDGIVDLRLVDVDEVVRREPTDLPGAARDLGDLVFHLRRIGIPDHTSMRLLILYGRRRGLVRGSVHRLATRALWLAGCRQAWRRARRLTGWLPRTRAPKSRALTPELVARVYGVKPTRQDADREGEGD
jgi:hypothetical protein